MSDSTVKSKTDVLQKNCVIKVNFSKSLYSYEEEKPENA